MPYNFRLKLNLGLFHGTNLSITMKISIDNNEYLVPAGITIIQACEIAGIEIPRFCYHERLAIAGNCRMCLVEVVGGPPKPVASCAMNIAEGMQIFTTTPMVQKAREGAMEFLLINHPLDCPVCDQGGECDLQDQAYHYGKGGSDFGENKRAVANKDFGPLVKTTMTRCIHCTRCVRFIEDIAGSVELGVANRGEKAEITTYIEHGIKSNLSGNIIDLCPVGALTSKPYSSKARSWELSKTETIDIMDSTCSNIRVDTRGAEVLRILPRLNEEINEEWLSDKSRFCYDGLKYQRIDQAFVKSSKTLEPTSVDFALNVIANRLKNANSQEVAILSGRLSSVEDIFAAKEFANALGVNNCESRLADQVINPDSRANFLLNSGISSLEEADVCLIIGCDIVKDAPLINARLRKSFAKKPNNIATIGLPPEYNLTYQYQNLGTNSLALEQIISKQHIFAKSLESAKKPVIIIGEDALIGNNASLLLGLIYKMSEVFNLQNSEWSGVNFLLKNTGLINGLELNFTAKDGIKNILHKITNQQIKTVFLLGVDDDIDFSLLKNSFVVYLGSHADKAVEYASVILPTPTYIEQVATYINTEGRAQQTKVATAPIGDALTIEEVFLQLLVKLNFTVEENYHHKLLKQYPYLFESFLPLYQGKKHFELAKKIELQQIISHFQIAINSNESFYLSNAIARASKILHRCNNLN